MRHFEGDGSGAALQIAGRLRYGRRFPAVRILQ
jgi:hypothetical protein